MNLESKFIIYALCDPRFLIVDPRYYRYVGKSTSGMNRPRSHAARSLIEKDHSRNWQKASWLEEMIGIGGYRIEVMQTLPNPVDGKDAERLGQELGHLERKWIAAARADGYLLLNRTDGGENVIGFMKGRKRGPRSQAHSAAQSAARKGRQTPAQKAANAARRGVPLSPEIRAAISKSLKGVHKSPESVAQRVATMIGSRRSLETRARMSAARMGKSPWNKGKKLNMPATEQT